MNTAGSRQILAALCPSPICCGSEAADRRWLSAVPPSFAAIGICYGVALIGRSHYRDQILARDDETTCYDPVVTEPPWIGYCSYARYLRQRMHPGSANTEATSLLRQKRGEGGRPSAPVLLYSSNSIYRHCAACKAPSHLIVQCREWPTPSRDRACRRSRFSLALSSELCGHRGLGRECGRIGAAS